MGVDGDLGVLSTAEDVLMRQSQLAEVARELSSVCPEAAEETRLLMWGDTPERRASGYIGMIDRHVERLMPLWYVVERAARGKGGLTTVADAVAKYRELPPVVEDPGVHAGCYRPDRAVDLAYLRVTADGVYRAWRLEETASVDLAEITDGVGLRYLLATLQEAADRVRDALDLQRAARLKSERRGGTGG
jgi:hypothetical protein